MTQAISDTLKNMKNSNLNFASKFYVRAEMINTSKLPKNWNEPESFKYTYKSQILKLCF